MRRFPAPLIVAMAAVLVASACTDEAGEVVTVADPQVQVETTAPDDSPGDAGDAGDEPSDAVDPDGSSDGGEVDEPEATTTAAAPVDDGDAGAGDVDAAALLASAQTRLDGRSVRGEASFGDPAVPIPAATLRAGFEVDADGDLAVTFELPAGFDPELPDGGVGETRYVDGVTYVRPVISDEMAAELGVGDGEAWYIADLEAVEDPTVEMLGAAGGIMCVFPQMEAPLDCDPLAETLTLFEAAHEAEVVGREEVRGVQTTRIRFQAALSAMAADMAPDGESVSPEGEGSEDEVFGDFFGLMDASLAAEVWLDDEGLIRRLTIDLFSIFAGLADPDDAETPSILVTLEFYDFGADISVDAPPPETIVDNPGPFQISGGSGGEASAG